MAHRREFLKQAGLVAAVSLLGPQALFAVPAQRPVGLQLYTLRDYISKDVPGVLAKVAKAGYQTVETYGYSSTNQFWGLSPKQFKKALAAAGLTTLSGHYELSDYVENGNQDALKTYIEAATWCGQAYVVVPHIDEKQYQSADDFRAVADKLNRAGEQCRAAGLKLAYHNHAFEFIRVGGTTLYDVLLRETQADLVDFELDLYWAVRAKRDPLALLKAYPNRFTLWHVKDMDRTRPELNTEIGAGSIDFVALFQHAKAAGLEQLFVEQENFAGDAFLSIAQSAAYIKKNLLS